MATTTTPPNAHSNPRMAAYRARMRAKGLKLVQFWAIDTSAPGFMENLREEIASINRADDRRVTEGMIELTDLSDWT